jgi:hypothetical protein
MPESLIIFEVLFVVMVVAIIAGGCWTISRSHSEIAKWAERSGFKLLECSPRILNRGPFFWKARRGEAVYHVRVQDRQGTVRSGWLLRRGLYFPISKATIEVKWEDET